MKFRKATVLVGCYWNSEVEANEVAVILEKNEIKDVVGPGVSHLSSRLLRLKFWPNKPKPKCRLKLPAVKVKLSPQQIRYISAIQPRSILNVCACWP